VAEPWERLVGEGAKRFAAFVRYRDMGPDRSLAKVAQALGKSTTLIERWSAQDSWVQRVGTWDEEQDRIWRAQQQGHRREVGRRQLRIANAMQGQLVNRLADLDVSQLTPRDLGYWLEITTKVQRQALGQADRTEVSGPDGGPVQLEALSTEQQRDRLRALAAEIARRAQGDPDAVPLAGAL